jgi:UDP-N-acetylglucosamine:LPS N-acetylglucosamine transferase
MVLKNRILKERPEMKNILFLSWQGGMGHITRDLAIVKELHRQNPEIRVQWMTHSLACRVLQEVGEELLPESEASADYNQVGVQSIRGFKLNLIKYVGLSKPAWDHNVALFKQVIAKYPFDLVLGMKPMKSRMLCRVGSSRWISRWS